MELYVVLDSVGPAGESVVVKATFKRPEADVAIRNGGPGARLNTVKVELPGSAAIYARTGKSDWRFLEEAATAESAWRKAARLNSEAIASGDERHQSFVALRGPREFPERLKKIESQHVVTDAAN